MLAQEFANALDAGGWKVKQRGGEYRSQCPAHDGDGLNLSFSDGEKDLVVTCHSHGCEFHDIMQAVERAAGREWKRRPNGAATGGPQVVARYSYADENGNVLYQVWRYHPKTFRPHTLNERNEWVPSLPKNVRRVLYRLPELLAADPKQPVFITNGEKACDYLRKRGLVATCSQGGELIKWRDYPQYAAALKGRYCVILQDNDEAGERHTTEVFAALTEAGVRARKLLLPSLPGGGDVVDWLEAGATTQELQQIAAPQPHPLDLKVYSGAALSELVLPEPEALVPHLLYRGFSTLLAGDSKLGKSSLLLRAILAAATGGWWLDRDRRPENRLMSCRILFTNFEDPLFLTRQRAEEMMAPDPLPDNFLTMEPPYGYTLSQVIEWIAEAKDRFRLDAVVLDPIAIAAEWEDEADNAKVALTFKALQRLASETQLAVLSAHHVTKKPGSYGLNIRGASAIKANVLGYLVLDRTKEGIRLTGINKLTGEWDVTLGRDRQGYQWWIEESHAGSTRTPQQWAKDQEKAEILALIRQAPGITTDGICGMRELVEGTCRNYLSELQSSGLIFEQKLPRDGRPGRPSIGWFAFPEAGSDE